jgi:hypothetical protein
LSDDNDEESSDSETPLKIDYQDGTIDEHEEIFDVQHEPLPANVVSPTKKKSTAPSSRKKVISHLIGTSSNTLTLDEPSPTKILPHESQFSEVKQTKSGRTIKYTPYFKELVQGATISPPLSPNHTVTPAKRPSAYAKKKQTSIKADLDAIKNASLTMNTSGRMKKNAVSGVSPKTKKQVTTPVKRLSQSKKSTKSKATVQGNASRSNINS